MATTKLPELREAVRISLGDDSVSPTIFTDDDAIDIWLRHGIRRASRIRPLYATEDLIPVANTIRYAAPTGMITLLRVAKVATVANMTEYEVDAVYEPAQNMIHLTDTGSFVLPSGDVFTVEYTKEYIVPADDNTDTDVPDKYIDAIRLFAVAQGLNWQARQVLSQNAGVVSFTVGRYAEKGSDPIKQLRAEAKISMEEFHEILRTHDPVIEFSRGSGSVERAPSLTGATFDEHGWTGEDDSSAMRPNAPGKTP